MHIIDLDTMPVSTADTAPSETLSDRIPEAAGVMLTLKPTDDGRYQLGATIPGGLSITVPCADIGTATEYLNFASSQMVILMDTMAAKPSGAADPTAGQSLVYGAGFICAMGLRAAIAAEAERMAQ